MQFTAFRLEFSKISKKACAYMRFKQCFNGSLSFYSDVLAFFWTAINMPLLDLDAEFGALSYAIYSFSIRVQKNTKICFWI